MAVERRPAFRALVLAVTVVAGFVVGGATASAAPGGKPKPTTTTTTKPADRNAPTTPANLRVTGSTTTSISLAWDPSTDNGSFSYVVRQDHLSWTVPGTEPSYTLTSLSPGRSYTFYVYAVDRDLNTSGNSNTVIASTQPDVVPPSAPVLTVLDVSPSQVWFSWTESTDDHPSYFIGYSVYVDGVVATGLNWIDHRRASLRHLAPGSTHTFQVTARDSGGNTTDSDVVTVTTPDSSDTAPPSAPTNLRIELDQGCAEVWLAWDQSTDDADPQSAIEYEVYVNGALSPLAVDTGVGRSFAYGTNQGLNSFVVKAVDRSGNTSAPSNTVTAELWPC